MKVKKKLKKAIQKFKIIHTNFKMKKGRLKKWFIYKTKRSFIRLRKTFRMAIKTMDHEKQGLNDIQKPLYDICMRLISDPNSQLRSSPIDYVFQIENEKYLIIIRPNNTSNTELYSISLVEYKEDSRDLSGFVEIPFPSDFTKIIIHRFEKEVQKRMKYRQIVKVTKVSSHLKEILNEMN
jgi:hypothetical protein